MQISYHPFYSILHNCSRDYVEYLCKILAHHIPVETLNLFKKHHELFLTNKYTFIALKSSDNLYDVKFYSGFLSQVIKQSTADNFIDFPNLKFTNFVDKYTCSDLNIDTVLLRQHQQDIITTCLNNKRGIVKSPTSSGKSFCIAELASKFINDNLKVLITVPTINLLHQMADDINNYRTLCNLDKLHIGKVGEGLLDFKNITIGIPNSLVKLDKTKEYLNTVDVLLADECHLNCTSMYLNILQNTIARKVTLGFSATPELNNDLDSLMRGFFGERIITITEESMIKNQIILEPLFKFYTAPKAFLPNSLSNNALNISNLSDQHRYKLMPQVYNYLIINNQGRNNLILEKGILEIEKNNGPIIVIVNKVKGDENHADILRDLFLSRGINLPIISGYISKKKKEQILNDLKNSMIKGVIAGPKVLTAGISIPSLSSIILCGAGKSNTDFIQRVGRLLRKKEGKQRPVVVDFCDQQFWFKNQSNSRIEIAKNIYGKNNIEIDI